MVLQFIIRKIRTRKKLIRKILSTLIRLVNRLTKFWLYFLIYIIFWWYSFKSGFDFVETDNIFLIFSYIYLPLALCLITFRLLRRFSRFISITLSVIALSSLPFIFILTSPAMTADGTLIDSYRYFYSLSLPIGIAGILLFINSIPAYIRLIFRKPQYFMFSFIILVSFFYVITIEYRFYNQFNGYDKFFCSYQKTREVNSPKVVRIIGAYGEGSGFFIDENTVLTNRHVVEGEEYPKVVLPDGRFITPIKVEMSLLYDIALIRLNQPMPDYVINMNPAILTPGEEALSFGYALGSDIKGSPTILPIRFEDYRTLPDDFSGYLQFSSPIVSGMSGGPVFDKCGDFVGINTLSTSGTSLIIDSQSFNLAKGNGLEEAKAIELKPGITPRDSVFAYYYLLKARDTDGCYSLLSKNYKTKSSYKEWTARFPNVISADVFRVQEIKKNLVYVAFGMVTWINGERSENYFEGTWEVIMDDGMYYLDKSHIVEIDSLYDAKGPESFLNPEMKK